MAVWISKTLSRPDQLNALNLMFLNLHKSGFTIAQIFFGTWLFPLGYLVYKSGFLPKWLGILLMVDCVGCLIWFFQLFPFTRLGQYYLSGAGDRHYRRNSR